MRPADAGVVIYALGGGLGHTVRACSLATALVAAGRTTTVLLPAENAVYGRSLGADVWPVERVSAPEALRRAVDRALAQLRPEQLIVDALPTGVLGELCALPAAPRRTLLLRLHRELKPDAVRSFDDVIDLEPNLRWRPASVPALELPPVCAVAARAPRDLDVALLPGADEKLRAFFSRLAPRLTSAGVSVALEPRGAPRPFSSQSARVVVGAAGYNLTYEAVAGGVWHVALPRARAFDDQRRRARALAQVALSPLDVERQVLRLLRETGERPRIIERTSYATLAAVLSEDRRLTPAPRSHVARA